MDKTVEKIVYLDIIFLNIVAVPVLPSSPSPESNVVVYSKESLIPGRLWEATLNWGKGFSFHKGVVLEIVLLRRKVDMTGKTFSSSFVRDCRFSIFLFFSLFCYYFFFFTNILIIPFVFRKYTSQYNPTVVFVCLRFFSIIWTSERRRLSIMTRNLPALRESCQFTEVRTFHNFCFSLDFLSPHFLMQCTFLPIVIHEVSWLII